MGKENAHPRDASSQTPEVLLHSICFPQPMVLQKPSCKPLRNLIKNGRLWPVRAPEVLIAFQYPTPAELLRVGKLQPLLRPEPWKFVGYGTS